MINNNAKYGMTLQSFICRENGLTPNQEAQAQYDAAYDDSISNELKPIVKNIMNKLSDKPVKSMSFEYDPETGLKGIHNFILASGRSLSLRTTRTSMKIAPRVLGQAGYKVLNDYFYDVLGKMIETQEDIKELIINHIAEIFPIIVDAFFASDITVLVFLDAVDPEKQFVIFDNKELSNMNYSPEQFSFTRNLENWNESTTLKIDGISVAEIQIHKHRTFKFRFDVKNIEKWVNLVKITNETFGISAESAICRKFNLVEPKSFIGRVSAGTINELAPVINEAFKHLPKAIVHTGSEVGNRGGKSKCSYDFILEGKRTLSLKSNFNGTKVCPPEVGQPNAKTAEEYFNGFIEGPLKVITTDSFKEMVLRNIKDILPIYVEHLFDSDYLLWIFKKNKSISYSIIGSIEKQKAMNFQWDSSSISFTKANLLEWNESNTLKYRGITIGEFQVHNNRSCYKFRFVLDNFLKVVLND